MGDAVKFRLAQLEDTLTNIESIVASIAHEVRQPLAAIAANGGEEVTALLVWDLVTASNSPAI